MNTVLAFAACVAAQASSPASPKSIDGYTIVTTMRLAKPYDVKAMNDEFQSARLIDEKDGVGTFEIVYRPLHVQEVGSNPNWRTEDARMTEYLMPRPCANWDDDLRRQILADLLKEGIDPAKLDDRSLVQRVADWAMHRANFNDQFGLWMVDFKGGKPQVSDKLAEAFGREEPQGLSMDEVFNRELYGKGMYVNKTHGACTSSSIYLATILRAMGIPTRIILTVPACDPNDAIQVKKLVGAVRLHRAAQAIKTGLNAKGFVNHVYNEVWIGKKWVRLNYNRLGQPILDANYCGLMTHIYTAKDISEIPLSSTWGTRYGLSEGPVLSSVNPYQMLTARDQVAPGVVLDNPEVASLKAVTVVKILQRGDTDLPEWAKLPEDADAFFAFKEWMPGQNYLQMREFSQDAASSFTLTAQGQPPVMAHLAGMNISDEHGGFQAFAVKLDGKLTPGVSYRVSANNTGHGHTWAFGADVKWVQAK